MKNMFAELLHLEMMSFVHEEIFSIVYIKKNLLLNTNRPKIVINREIR